MTNIRHLVYWKCIIWAKSGLPIINSVCEKVWFTISGLSKMQFFNFCLFHFSKFQVAIVKNLIKKPYFFISHKYFDLHTFDNETTALLKVFEISTEMHFVSLFFLNERKITTSILMIQLKSTVVHYAIINSSTISKPFLRVVEYAISFFSIFCLSLFQQGFCQ